MHTKPFVSFTGQLLWRDFFCIVPLGALNFYHMKGNKERYNSTHVLLPFFCLYHLQLLHHVNDLDTKYSLFVAVVHVGSGPNHGYNVSLVKSHNHWLFFDDENVEMVGESTLQTFFGSSHEYSCNTDEQAIFNATASRCCYRLGQHFF